MLPSTATVNAPLRQRIGVVACLLLAALAVTGGCHKAPSTTPPPAPLPTDLAAARDTVLTYLKALDAGDIKQAYRLLSTASQAKMTLPAFTTAVQAGKTDYSQDKVRVDLIDASHVLVTVQLFEDPAEHGFRLVQSYGEWRIEMLGGTPFAPAGQP